MMRITKSFYKCWDVTPKCLFSRDVTSGHHSVTRLRSCHNRVVVWSLYILTPVHGAVTLYSDAEQLTSMLNFKF